MMRTSRLSDLASIYYEAGKWVHFPASRYDPPSSTDC